MIFEGIRKLKRVSVVKKIFAITPLLVALLLLLVPVKTQFTDPCGSVIFSEKVTFVENGQMKNEVTPPCSDKHKERLLVTVPLISMSLIVAGFSIFLNRKADEPDRKEDD